MEYPWYISPFMYKGKEHDFFQEERLLYDKLRKVNGPLAKYPEFDRLCDLSPAYYLSNLKIVPKSAVKIKFDTLNLGQQLIYKSFIYQLKTNVPIRIVVLKARQVGITTLCAGLIFWFTTRFETIKALSLTYKAEMVPDIMSKFDAFLASHDDLYSAYPTKQLKIKKANQSAIEFGDKRRNATSDKRKKKEGKSIESSYSIKTAGVRSGIRGITAQVLHCTEVAFWENSDSWLATAQAVPNIPNTFIIIESTATAGAELFKEHWDNADSGLSEYDPVFIGWNTQEEYQRPLAPMDQTPEGLLDYVRSYDQDESLLVTRLSATPEQINWRRHKIKSDCRNDILLFKQEYPSNANEAFISKGGAIYSGEGLQYLSNLVANEDFARPIFVGDFTRGLSGWEIIPQQYDDGIAKIWKQPEAGHTYVVGVDSAQGKEQDFSCAQVLDLSNFEQVAMIRSSTVRTELFAEQVIMISQYYSNGLIVAEANDGTLMHHLTRSSYAPNLYRKEVNNTYNFAPTSSTGWYMTESSKKQIIDWLTDFINNKRFIIHDKITVRECTTFSRNAKGKLGALGKDSHDDTHIALGLTLAGLNSTQVIYNTPISMGSRRLTQAGANHNLKPAGQINREKAYKDLYNIY